MTNSEFYLLLALALVMLLLSGSVWVWIQLMLSLYHQTPWMEPIDEPRADWTRFPEVTAMFLVALLIALHLIPRFDTAPSPDTELTLGRLTSHLIFTASVSLLLPAILICGRPPAEFGFKVRPVRTQILDGLRGFLLALVPTGLLMLATAPFRNRQTQNPLLTLLSDTNDPAIVALICLAAAVVAPLYEELMFRVILQGWLGSVLRPRTAIVLTAALFAAIHGAIDGVALVPLALVLGFVFQQRHSYLSVVVIHGLFNGTMLVLALLTQNLI
ncbi:MAG: CPBP family intramembrane metalloprotease [Planctomycetes bacterium]|nr:CPBP family intramembrane metalloprotease [Planctomycetota bacterium]